MQVALVTGAGGFVASYLVGRLLNSDYKVKAFIRRKADGSIPSHLIEMQRFGANLEIVKGDIIDYHDVRKAVEGTDKIFHLASQSFVPDSVDNPGYTHSVNTGGTLNVLEAVRNHNTGQRMVFASSSEVYGFQWPDELPLNEASEPRPQSPYASAKLYAELLCKNYYDNYNVRAVISRAFNHEGPGRGHHFVTASIVRQMVMLKKQETDALHVGDITPTRDWNHVADIVEAYVLLSESGYPGQVYVIGSGVETSVNDFIRRTALLLSLDDFKIIQNQSLMRRADVPRLRANARKIRDLGWSPQLSLDDIIAEMIAYYNGMSENKRLNLEPHRDKGYEITLTLPPPGTEEYPFIEKDRRVK